MRPTAQTPDYTALRLHPAFAEHPDASRKCLPNIGYKNSTSPDALLLLMKVTKELCSDQLVETAPACIGFCLFIGPHHNAANSVVARLRANMYAIRRVAPNCSGDVRSRCVCNRHRENDCDPKQSGSSHLSISLLTGGKSECLSALKKLQ